MFRDSKWSCITGSTFSSSLVWISSSPHLYAHILTIKMNKWTKLWRNYWLLNWHRLWKCYGDLNIKTCFHQRIKHLDPMIPMKSWCKGPSHESSQCPQRRCPQNTRCRMSQEHSFAISDKMLLHSQKCTGYTNFIGTWLQVFLFLHDHGQYQSCGFVPKSTSTLPHLWYTSMYSC